MSENSAGYEDRGLARDPLDPVTRGLEFIKDHHRFWLHPDGQEGVSTSRHLPGLDDLVVLTDLPEHVEVDPDLQTSIHPYPPMRSEMPLPNISDVVEQIRSAHDQPSGGQ